MAHQFDDDQDGYPREDDRLTSPYDEITAGNPYHFSRGTQMFLRIVAVILALSMTALFLRGFINQ